MTISLVQENWKRLYSSPNINHIRNRCLNNWFKSEREREGEGKEERE